MGGDRAARQTHADVAADLAHPHRPTFEGDRRQPQPHVVALVHIAAALLQGHVLAAAEQIKGGDRGVAVAAPEQGRTHGAPEGAHAEGLGHVPAPPRQGGEHGVPAAHDHHIERIGGGATVAASGAAGHIVLEPVAQPHLIEVPQLGGGVEAIPVHLLEIGGVAGHLGEEGEASQFGLGPGSHQLEARVLDALIQVGEHEAGGGRLRFHHRRQSHPVEVRIHLPVGGGREGAMADPGHLHGGVVLAVDGDRRQIPAAFFPVHHLHPHRLDAGGRHVVTQQPLGFLGGEGRHRHVHAAIDPALAPAQQRGLIHGARSDGAAPHQTRQQQRCAGQGPRPPHRSPFGGTPIKLRGLAMASPQPRPAVPQGTSKALPSGLGLPSRAQSLDSGGGG